MERREFTVHGAYQYNRTGPKRWILSHIMRYWWLPVIMVISSVGANAMASYAGAYMATPSGGWKGRHLPCAIC